MIVSTQFWLEMTRSDKRLALQISDHKETEEKLSFPPQSDSSSSQKPFLDLTLEVVAPIMGNGHSR